MPREMPASKAPFAAVGRRLDDLTRRKNPRPSTHCLAWDGCTTTARDPCRCIHSASSHSFTSRRCGLGALLQPLASITVVPTSQQQRTQLPGFFFESRGCRVDFVNAVDLC